LRQAPLWTGIRQSGNGFAEKPLSTKTIEQSFPASDPLSTDPNPDRDTEKYPKVRERGDDHG